MNMNQCKQWLQGHADLAIDLVRIYLGLGLFFKAIYFMSHRDDLIRLLEGAGNLYVAPAMAAHYVIPAHLVGGLLLTIGLLTRVAALAQIPILFGAIFYVHLPNIMRVEPRQELEFATLVLFLLVLIFIYGGGRLSVDYLLSRKGKTELHPQPAT